jgi:hypothetical protein
MGINSGSVSRDVSINGCWKTIDPGREDVTPPPVLGGVWLGAELVGESGVGTCSLDDDSSLDEDNKLLCLSRAGGCGDGEDLGESLGDPENVLMNERTGGGSTS